MFQYHTGSGDYAKAGTQHAHGILANNHPDNIPRSLGYIGKECQCLYIASVRLGNFTKMSSRKFADKFTVMSLATMLIAIFSKTLLAGEATIYGEQGHTGSDSTQKNRRQPREYNKYIYPLRHLVENAFLHLKQWREIATQYAKNTASFLAAMHVRCIAIWAKIY